MPLFDNNFIILSTWLHNYYYYYSYYYYFQPASANLIAYFPLKPMAYAFYITGRPFHVLKVSFYESFASYSYWLCHFSPR